MNATSSVTDWGFKLLLLSIVLALLPQSPFNMISDLVNDIPYLNYLNWFIPFQQIVGILQTWLIAVNLYYGYMVTLRYAHGIKGA